MERRISDETVRTFVIAGVILIIALIVLFVYKPTTMSDSVSVSGIALVKAMPDLVTVYFNIETNASNSSEASNLNNKIYEKFVDNLVAAGFEEDDLITDNFNVYQDYDWTEKGRVDKGFKASHFLRLEIEMEDEDKIGSAIDAGTNVGALINSINFELTQESQNKYKAEAMNLAAKDARIKAESVAEGFNKKVGKLVSVQVDNFGYTPWNIYSSSGMGMTEDAMMAKEVSVNINPGEKEISASVTAVYKLR